VRQAAVVTATRQQNGEVQAEVVNGRVTRRQAKRGRRRHTGIRGRQARYVPGNGKRQAEKEEAGSNAVERYNQKRNESVQNGTAKTAAQERKTQCAFQENETAET